MTYPKPVMRLTELQRMGFPKDYLLFVYNLRNQKIAWKMNVKRNSPILFDTDELEKLRKAQCSGGRGYGE